MRLIDANALKQQVESPYTEYPIMIQIRKALKDFIDEAPTIDPVKHGKWMYKDLGGWHCSVCGEQAPFWCMATTQNLSNYCPNCGAKVEEKK